MNKKATVTFFSIVIILVVFSQISIAKTEIGAVQEGGICITYRNATVYAPAVAETSRGYKGVMSTITVTIQSHGSGRVFVDTMPLAQVDMQGSARLAVKVASSHIKNDASFTVNPASYDYFFVVRTGSPIIGGPSAGAIMAMTTLALLMNETMMNNTVMTGMINPDGAIGPVGGITHKIDAAAEFGAKRFLIPRGQGTYTERIDGRLVQRNAADYALDNHDIEAIEVSTLREVVENYTGRGYDISVNPIDTKEFEDVFKPIADRLLENAENQTKNAYNIFNNSKDLIPTSVRINIWNTINYQNEIKNLIDSSIDEKNRAMFYYDKGGHYTSTSYSYRSLMSSRVVIYFCNFFIADDGEIYVSEVLENVTNIFQNESELAKNKPIDDLISLQAVGAAQKRASMARNYLSDAEEKFQNGEYLNSLKYLAWAKERADNIDWWLELPDYFDGSINIKEEEINDLAIDYIGEAQQAIIYSKILLSQLGLTSDYLTGSNGAEEILENARTDKDGGYPASALFQALEALVKANLAIETIGLDRDEHYTERINFAIETTTLNININEIQEIEPLLPICYYEYAESLHDEGDYKNSLFYYKLSGMISGALDFKNISKGNLASRYVGTPEIRKREYEEETIQVINEELLLILMIGIVLGTALALLAMEAKKSGEEKKQKEKWMPRSIIEYENNKGRSSYQNEIPRNIEDYYKKNK